MPNPYWIPLEGELAYEELPSVLEEAADRFQLGAPHLPPYLALLAPMDGLTEEPRDPSRDYWMVTLLYPSGSQYAVSLRADTGELSAWVRWPQGFYTDGGASASPAASSGAARSEEELQAVSLSAGRTGRFLLAISAPAAVSRWNWRTGPACSSPRRNRTAPSAP